MIQGYTSTNKVTNGTGNTKARCQMSQTITAFMWFNFALYIVTALFSFTGGRANMRSGGLKPSMSQRVQKTRKDDAPKAHVDENGSSQPYAGSTPNEPHPKAWDEESGRWTYDGDTITSRPMNS